MSVLGKTVRGQVGEWQRSLSEMDPELTIEGVFDLQGCSLCLLSMPLSLWDSFIHPAYKFVSYVDSHNVLASGPVADGLSVTTLPERPKDHAYVDYVMLSDTDE